MNNNIDEKQLLFGSYYRKSSDSEDKQVQSIETQARELLDFAQRMTLNVVLDWKEEKSAFKVGRETFAEVIKAINTRRINALLVVHPNRLARNPIDGAIIIDALDRGVLLCVKTPTRTYYNSSIDKMMLGLEFLFSKRDSDDKSAFVKNGQKTKALKGYPHGVAAIGFANDKAEEKGNRTWKIDEIKYPIVEKIFLMFLTGSWSGNRLACHIRENFKLTTPKHKRSGGSLVTISRVFEILKNPIYAGFFYQAGQRYDLNDHLPRMITEDQHYRILRMLSSKNIPKAKNHVTTYTGFIWSPTGHFIGPDIKFQLICDCKKKFSYSNKDKCPKCQKLIIDMDRPRYLEYTYYYNIVYRKNRLPTRYLREDTISDFIISYFKENLAHSSALVQWIKKHLYKMKDRDQKLNRVFLNRSQEELKTLDKRKSKIIQLMADDAISAQDGRSALQELTTNSLSLNVKQPSANWFEIVTNFIDVVSDFVNVMKSTDINAKRTVLSQFGSNLIWNEERLSIINVKWIDVLIEGMKEEKRKTPQFEPENIVDISDSNEVFAAVYPGLLRTWDNVRTAILEEGNIKTKTRP